MGAIVAVVSTDPRQVGGGGAPFFFVSSGEQCQQVAFLLEKILDASAHDLKNGTMILVDHKQ